MIRKIIKIDEEKCNGCGLCATACHEGAIEMINGKAKLTAIIASNNIKSVTVVRIEVPCCGGIENAVKNALRASGKFIPWQVVTISTDGNINFF